MFIRAWVITDWEGENETASEGKSMKRLLELEDYLNSHRYGLKFGGTAVRRLEIWYS